MLRARQTRTRPRGRAALTDLYGPLCDADAVRPFAIAHLAQSLDGRIATTSGLSKWLSGDEDLLLDQIDAGDHFGHRVLDLDASVHLNEVVLAVLIDDEFDGRGVHVVGR